MSEINNNQHEVSDPLRLDRCPDCGYLLEGLPEQGICPECGFAYRPDLIVLYGWAAGWKASLANARGRTLVWSVVVADFALVSHMCRSLYEGRVLWALLSLGVIVATNSWLLQRRRRVLEDAPRPEQLRLLLEGTSQRTGVGKVKLVPWNKVKWLVVNWRGGDRYQIEGKHDQRVWWRSNSETIHADVDLGPHELDRVLRRLAECFPKLRVYDIRDQSRVRRMQDLEKQYGLQSAAGT